MSFFLIYPNVINDVVTWEFGVGWVATIVSPDGQIEEDVVGLLEGVFGPAKFVGWIYGVL